jgi:hypothetical protein
MTETQSLALHENASPVAQMLQAVCAKGVTQDNVGALEKLVDLYERMEIREAEKQFAAAFVALQSELPEIQAQHAVPGNDGTVRYTYAAFEDIARQIKPHLLKHGFTFSFSSDVKDGRVIQECTLQHVGGFKKVNRFAARIGKGPPASSEAQGDGAASTYAKRFALCDALGVSVTRDSDARAEGAPITADQAAYLREQVKDTGSDEATFLQVANAARFEDIGADRYDFLASMLAKKAEVKRRKGL